MRTEFIRAFEEKSFSVGKILVATDLSYITQVLTAFVKKKVLALPSPNGITMNGRGKKKDKIKYYLL